MVAIIIAYFALVVCFLALSFRVVYALTGDFAFTARASFTTRWLRRVPVRRGLVRFFGLPKVNSFMFYLMIVCKLQGIITKIHPYHKGAVSIDFLKSLLST